MPAKKAKTKSKKKAAKKTAKKKAVKKTAKKSAKKPAKKKVVKKSQKKTAKKSAKKAIKKAAKPKKTIKPKTVVKAAKPKAPQAPKGTPVTFVLDAPNGWDVALAGTFNKWEPRAMVKEPDGLWRITVHLAPGTYQYRFLVDTEWREDPANERHIVNEYGTHNSVIDVS